jgi:hypothetical protein
MENFSTLNVCRCLRSANEYRSKPCRRSVMCLAIMKHWKSVRMRGERGIGYSLLAESHDEPQKPPSMTFYYLETDSRGGVRV